MERHKPAITEEMKQFLQEGLRLYPPAVVALSEFQRQVRSRLQYVLDEFSEQFSELGLPVANLKPYESVRNEPDLRKGTGIGLVKSQGTQLYVYYFIKWDLEKPKEKQAWVAVEIWLNKADSRNRLFSALQQQRSGLTSVNLAQISGGEFGGSSHLSSHCDSDQFYTFDDTFRTLLEDCLKLFQGIGGLEPFLTAGPDPP